MNGDEMMAAEVETSGAFSVRALRSLFAFPQLFRMRGFPYGVAADGRFLMIKSNALSGERPMQLNVVVNWLEEIEPLAAPR